MTGMFFTMACLHLLQTCFKHATKDWPKREACKLGRLNTKIPKICRQRIVEDGSTFVIKYMSRKRICYTLLSPVARHPRAVIQRPPWSQAWSTDPKDTTSLCSVGSLRRQLEACHGHGQMGMGWKLLLPYWKNPQVRAGTLEEDFRPPKRCLKWFSKRGALGINELFLDLWQLVLGRFWNQIFGNQAYDPRAPSFWSLSVVKKRDQKLHPSKTMQNPQSHKLNYPPVSFAPMLIPFSYFKSS